MERSRTRIKRLEKRAPDGRTMSALTVGKSVVIAMQRIETPKEGGQWFFVSLWARMLAMRMWLMSWTSHPVCVGGGGGGHPEGGGYLGKYSTPIANPIVQIPSRRWIDAN